MPGGIPAGLDGPNRDAYVVLQSLLNSWGLGSLAPVVAGYIKQGYGSDAITYLLQQTPQFKQRFAGNDLRIKNGLAPLDPATYLSVEAGYSQALRAAGLPGNFYNNQSDYANWIGGDVSPSEVKARADEAAKRLDQADPYFMSAMKEYYNVDQSHLAAYFLDMQRGLPLIQQQEASAAIGGAAAAHGFNLAQNEAQQYAALGVTQREADTAYGKIQHVLPEEQQLAQIYGVDKNISADTMGQELLGNNGAAAAARSQLNMTAKADFAGKGGIGSTFYRPAYGLTEDTVGAW